MKILCMTHAYPRFPGDVAGAFIAHLNNGLARLDHDIQVVTPADRGRPPPEGKKNVEVVHFRYAPRRFETLAYSGTMVEQAKNPLGMATLANLVRKQSRFAADLKMNWRPDVIHAHWWFPAGLAAWWGSRNSRIPYVVTMHGTDVRMLAGSKLGRKLAKRVLRGAAGITTVSAFLADAVVKLTDIDRNRIVVQPMPVETAQFRTASKGGDGVVVLGRLTAQKHLRIILEAIARLKQRGTPLPASFIGDGPERHNLEKLVADLNIANLITFHGTVEPQLVSGLVGNADVGVFTAKAEGFGLAAAELLMLGVPVIACQGGGGLLEILDDPEAGAIVPDEDPNQLATAILSVAKDTVARKAAKAAGDRWREKLSQDNVAAVYDKLFHEAVNAG